MSAKRRIGQFARKALSRSVSLSVLGQRTWFLLNKSHVPRSFRNCPPQDRIVLEQIKERGYCVVPAFVPADACRQCIEETERLFREHREFVHQGEDLRVFGAEHVSAPIRRFAHDPWLIQIANAYTGRRNRLFCTLTNKIVYQEDGLGSGGGWHRDGFFPEIKAILYLNDVDGETGPFQILEGSHARGQVLRDMRTADLRFLQNRIDLQADALVEHDPSRHKSLSGGAGTLLLFDTSAIHRGAPLRRGVRYALTNYILDETIPTQTLYDTYAPIIRESHIKGDRLTGDSGCVTAGAIRPKPETNLATSERLGQAR
ncbi:MAG: phytanoyl-CoA dioxygenase family protein [Planctomycetes bacterium]|nr:phytanoyl-CoA dioxygenase family protein [Planctomycetota bacterium]